MLPFLIVLVGGALIIAFGVSVSSYLHSHEANRRHSLRAPAYAAQAAYDDDDDGFRMATGVLTDATSRYARSALFVMAGALVFAALFVTMLLH